MNAFYHTRTLGVTWSPVRAGTLGDWDYDIVFSTGGPPFFEVIHGPAGSPWDATDGSRFDHIGYWSISRCSRDFATPGPRM
ncbi:hypothetical protein [Amycolatopsis sp. w19]|uniref:hypothetical protein n=1 Tax=Amycolatopsis sp. w19 TaxID=3448134 RepID=UPI003F1A6565